jgi:hypothetical protein
MDSRPLMASDLPGTTRSAAVDAPPVPEGYRRVFRRGAEVAHYLDVLDDPALGTPARCGSEPIIGEPWRGIVAWSEQQKLNRMKDCKRCVRHIREDQAA